MVKRMIDPNESRERALRFEFGGHRFERGTRTRKCDRTRPVYGGDRDGSIVSRNERQGFVFLQSYREHRSFAASARFHETRSLRDNLDRFFQRKNTGDACRLDLTHAMTDDRGRFNAP